MKKIFALVLTFLMVLGCMSTLLVNISADEAAELNYTTQEFTLFEENEKAFLHVSTDAAKNDKSRFTDRKLQLVYQYNVTSTNVVKEITWTASIGQGYLLCFSTDLENWVEIARQEVRETKRQVLTFSVPEDMIAQVLAAGRLYVRVTDSTPDNGYGGSVGTEAPVVLSVGCTDELIDVPEDTLKYDTQEFTVFEENEKAFLHASTDAAKNDQCRFSDRALQLIYQYTVKSINKVKEITWTAPIGQGYLLCFSTDLENWVEIARQEYGETPRKSLTFAVPEDMIAEVLSAGTLYVRVTDSTPDGGWGGAVGKEEPVVLSVGYTEATDEEKNVAEMTVTEHSKPLFGCNETWEEGWTLDTENELAGAGCLSTTYKKDYDNAPTVTFDPVDATGMDTLEFDIYLGNLAYLNDCIANGFNGCIEIGSAGKCDNSELAWNAPQLAQWLMNNGAVQGWNHVAIPLKDMKATDGETGAFDISKVNFIRFFMVGTAEWSEDVSYEIKLDSFCLTDAQAQTIVVFEEANARLLASLKNLEQYASAGSITADNVSTVKSAIASIETQIAALTGNDQELVKAYTAPLTQTKKAVEDYEKAVAEAEAAAEAKANAIAANKALYDAIKALMTSGITDENYESAKAAVDSAMTGWNALSAEVQGYFEEDGLKTMLDAAKAAVDAFTPTTGGDGGCKSALTVGAGAMVLLFGAWVAICSRKKEN